MVLLILLRFRWISIAFVAFRSGRFWCETGAMRELLISGVIVREGGADGENPSGLATRPDVSFYQLAKYKPHPPAPSATARSGDEVDFDQSAWETCKRRAQESWQL